MSVLSVTVFPERCLFVMRELRQLGLSSWLRDEEGVALVGETVIGLFGSGRCNHAFVLSLGHIQY